MKDNLYEAIAVPNLDLFIDIYNKNCSQYNFVDVLSKILSMFEVIDSNQPENFIIITDILRALLRYHKFDAVTLNTNVSYQIPFDIFKIIVKSGLVITDPNNKIVIGFLKNDLELRHLEFLLENKFDMMSLPDKCVVQLLLSKDKYIYRLFNKYYGFDKLSDNIIVKVIKCKSQSRLLFFMEYLSRHEYLSTIFNTESIIDWIYHICIKYCYIDVIKLLLANNIVPNTQLHFNEETTKMIQLLTANNIDITYIISKLFLDAR